MHPLLRATQHVRRQGANRGAKWLAGDYSFADIGFYMASLFGERQSAYYRCDTKTFGVAGSHDGAHGRNACRQRNGKLAAGSRAASTRVHEASRFALKYYPPIFRAQSSFEMQPLPSSTRSIRHGGATTRACGNAQAGGNTSRSLLTLASDTLQRSPRLFQYGGRSGLGRAGVEGRFRRIRHVQLNRPRDIVPTQLRRELQGTIDTGSNAGCKDATAIDDYPSVHRNGTEERQ